MPQSHTNPKRGALSTKTAVEPFPRPRTMDSSARKHPAPDSPSEIAKPNSASCENGAYPNDDQGAPSVTQLSTALASSMTGFQVSVIAFAALVMILGVLNAIRTGEIKLKFGLTARRRDEPVVFWLCLAGLVVAALFGVAFFAVSFADSMDWLGQAADR